MKAVVLNGRQARSLVSSYDKLTTWIWNHAELCEERAELRKMERAANSAGAVIDQIDAQLKAQR